VTIDDRLREGLRRRADAVVPVEGDWDHVARRLGRSRRPGWRLTVPAGLAAAAVLIAAVLLSMGGHAGGPHPIGTAGPAPARGAPEASLAPGATTTAPPPATTSADPGRGPAGGPVPAGFRPVSVTWISARQGWVLGTAPCSEPPCTSLVRTTDGGASWAGVPAPPTELARTRRVRFADQRNGWIYGPDLWATHDGGLTWRRLDAPEGDVVSLEAAGGEVYAVVRSAAAHLFTWSADADAWRQDGSDAVDVFAELTFHGTDGYVMGGDGSVLALSAGGLQRRGSPCGYPSGALAAGGPDLFAVCVSDAGLGSSTKTLMVSTDGARTWSPAGTSPRGGQPSGLAAASGSTVVLAANSGASFLYRTDDGGATWTTVFTDSTLGGAGFADLGFTTASRGVAVLGGALAPASRLLLTDDGGLTWSTVTFGS
jgi:photosystem II stability/assembly factor-like uncharacterized protein